MQKEAVKSANLWIIKAGAFIIPFIPLYISRVLFFPYITGKAFVFRILVEIIFAAWIYLAVFYKEYRPKITPLSAAIGIFILAVALATFFGINPAKSFWSNYERMEGLVTYVHLFAYFLVLANVFNKSDWKIFLNLFLIAAIYENSFAFLQRIGVLLSPQGGTGRADGTIGNPTYLAAYLIFILGFSLLLLLEANKKWQKYLYALMAAWTTVTIYFTATRGATLALLGGVFIFGILYLIFKKTETPKEVFAKKLTIISLIAVLLAAGGIWSLREKPFVKSNAILSRLTSLSLKERTISSRFTIWRMGWEGFGERPILGWGPENYEIVFSKYFKPELWRQEPWFDRSHNIIFDWLINAGLLGALSYFSIFAAAIYILWKKLLEKNISTEKSVLLTVFLLVYLAQNLFVFDQIATYISFFALLAYINGLAIPEPDKNFSAPKRERNRIPEEMPLLAGAVLIPLAVIIYFVNIRPLLANLNLLGALAVQNRDFQGAYEKYDKALSYNTFGNQEIREQLARFSINVGGIAELSPDFRDQILRRAIAEAEKGVSEKPLDPRAYLFLGMIYHKVGLSDIGLQAFNKALELSPNKQQIYFEIADVYLQKRDYLKAVEVLEKAFYLDTDYNAAGINLAAAYILNGQQEKADALLLEYRGAVDVPDQILAQVYSSRKDYGRVIRIWKAFVEQYPHNIEYWKNLAGAYLAVNDNDSAIKTLEVAIKKFPEFKIEGENLIKQIKNQ